MKHYLPGQDKRAQHMRLDIAKTLKLYFHAHQKIYRSKRLFSYFVQVVDTYWKNRTTLCEFEVPVDLHS